MPKRIVPLTDTKVRTAKPKEKPQKLFYGGSLSLLVTPTGGKLWNLKYRIDGRATVAMLEKATGFPRPKIYAITSRLRQQGRISYVAHGVYGRP